MSEIGYVFRKLFRFKGIGALADTWYQGVTGVLTPVPIGNEGEVYTVVDGVPAWSGAAAAIYEPLCIGNPDDPGFPGLLFTADGDVTMVVVGS